jgi:hypothetical protein
MILMMSCYPHVSLRQWQEIIKVICEQLAVWANTINAKPLSYALLKEGDTKLNCGAESAKYT